MPKLQPGRAPVHRRPPDEPTPRQLEVLALAAAGLTVAMIAQRLSISPKTVDKHKQGAFDALGAVGIVQALVLAHQRRLLDLDHVHPLTSRIFPH